MRLHGWCEKCHKIRPVRVSGHGMAMAARGIPTGICSRCEQDEEDRRRSRRR